MFINGTGIIMRISFILVVVFALLVESVDCSQGKKNDPKLGTDWKEDPVCKAVYDGVLKGLYRDQVSDEIVTNIIGKKTKTKDRKALRKHTCGPSSWLDGVWVPSGPRARNISSPRSQNL